MGREATRRMVLPGRGMSWREFFHALMKEWERDDLGDIAGAVTFFGITAIFPFLLFLVSLASLVIDPELAESLIEQLDEVAPPQVTEILGGFLQTLGAGQDTGLLTVSALASVWIASGGVAALMRALNKAYDVKESRPFWKVRLIAIAATIVAAMLSVVGAFIAVATPAVAQAIGPPAEDLALWLRLPVAGFVMMLVWALLYYFLPDVEQKFRFITPGSVVGVLIWLLASWGFSLYVVNFGRYEVTYGALGGIIVLLFWMWLSSLMVLLGAVINAVLEHRAPEGKKVGAHSFAETGPSATAAEKEEAERIRRLPAPVAVGPAVPVDPRERREAARQMAARKSAGASVGGMLLAVVGLAFFLRRAR